MSTVDDGVVLENDRIGCEVCWPAAAEAAWEARRGLACERELVDESHYHVMILACPRCGQRFLSVFTETIDWADGDDPQHSALLPITEADALTLALESESVREERIDTLGPRRRSLQRDRPKGAQPRTYWGTGICVGCHD